MQMTLGQFNEQLEACETVVELGSMPPLALPMLLLTMLYGVGDEGLTVAEMTEDVARIRRRAIRQEAVDEALRRLRDVVVHGRGYVLDSGRLRGEQTVWVHRLHIRRGLK